MLKKSRSGIVVVTVILVFVVALMGVTTQAAYAAEPAPTPCMDCGGNWDRTCGRDGDNFSRHDAVPSELIIGLPDRNSVYELSWEGNDGAFSDGNVRIVAQLGKGQMRFIGGFTTNGYCYYDTGREVTNYLTSGQAGHVRGLQYCTDLTADYIPTVYVDTISGQVTILVSGERGPSISEIQKHLQPLQHAQPPTAEAPAAVQQPAQPPTAEAPKPAAPAAKPAAVAPAPVQPPAVQQPAGLAAPRTINEILPWLIAAASTLCCLSVIVIVALVLLIRWANRRQPPAAQPPANP